MQTNLIFLSSIGINLEQKSYIVFFGHLKQFKPQISTRDLLNEMLWNTLEQNCPWG